MYANSKTLFVCKAYLNVRKMYLKKYYYQKPSVFKLVQLLCTNNVKELRKLSHEKPTVNHFVIYKIAFKLISLMKNRVRGGS